MDATDRIRSAHCGFLCRTIVMLTILSPVLRPDRARAQSLGVPPPPRYPDRGEVTLAFEASGSMNDPEGDEALAATSFGVVRRGGFDLVGLDVRLSLELELGVSYRNDTNDMEVRIEENRLRVGTLVTLPVGWRLDPYLAGALETTPTESFRYGPRGPVRVAMFWDPVATLESAGASVVVKQERFTVAARVGLALEQIRSVRHTEKTDDRETEGVVESWRSQSGIEVAGDAVWQVDSSGLVESRLLLFGTFDDLRTWRLLSENRIRVRFAEALAFTWQVDLRHDVEQTLRTQLVSRMAIGLTAPL